MSETIILKKSPRIEFQFLENGFRLKDEQTIKNSGFYLYRDLHSIELNKTWFPLLAKYLRAFTWLMNGVPFFPDAESCKKSNIIFRLENSKIGLWLTDTDMVHAARKLKKYVDLKVK